MVHAFVRFRFIYKTLVVPYQKLDGNQLCANDTHISVLYSFVKQTIFSFGKILVLDLFNKISFNLNGIHCVVIYHSR